MRAVLACRHTRRLTRSHTLIPLPEYHSVRRGIVAHCSTGASSSQADVVATEAHSTAAQPDTKPSKLKLWLLCIKPPMYAVGIAPMVLAGALAYVVTGTFPETCGDFTFGGILVIAWLNLRFASSPSPAFQPSISFACTLPSDSAGSHLLIAYQ